VSEETPGLVTKAEILDAAVCAVCDAMSNGPRVFTGPAEAVKAYLGVRALLDKHLAKACDVPLAQFTLGAPSA
jgi:hypothetical protein